MLTISDAADQLDAHVTALVAQIVEPGQDAALVRGRLLAAMSDPVVDARAHDWTVRVQLVGPDNAVVADTDPAAPPGGAGTQTARGLGGAVALISGLVDSYHHGRATGAGPAALRARIGSLRTQLSKSGGQALWRIRYTVDGETWMALATVCKASA